MNITLDKQSQNFLIKNELTEFRIDILSRNNNFLISENENIFLLSLKKDTQCLAQRLKTINNSWGNLCLGISIAFIFLEYKYGFIFFPIIVTE